jgi:hypothetical protein
MNRGKIYNLTGVVLLCISSVFLLITVSRFFPFWVILGFIGLIFLIVGFSKRDSASAKYCGACGKSNPTDVRHCVKCGKSFKE